MSRDSEKHSRQNYATKAAHLRGEVFKLEGFKSNERVPSWEDARAMAERNRSKIAGRAVEGSWKTPSIV